MHRPGLEPTILGFSQAAIDAEMSAGPLPVSRSG